MPRARSLAAALLSERAGSEKRLIRKSAETCKTISEANQTRLLTPET